MVGWNRRTSNQADVGTKRNRSPVETYDIPATTGVIQFDLKSMEVARRNRSLGLKI